MFADAPSSYHSRYYGRLRYRGLSGLEPSGFRIAPEDGSPLPPPSTRTLLSHGNTTLSASVYRFRSIIEDDDEDAINNNAQQQQDNNETYVALRADEVLIEAPQAREVEPTSFVHLTGQASIQPMKANNNEFFLYKRHLFQQKLQEINGMIISRKYYKAPNNETRGFLARLVRLFIDCTVQFWRLNRDGDNRMRFTRALGDLIHMQCAIESFLLAEVMESHDSEFPATYASKRRAAFQMRNTFRIFAQNMALYDKIFHLGFQISNNRFFDFFAQFPGISMIAAFPPSENVVGSLNLALNSILRNVMEGTMMGRRISGNQQSLVTINPNAYAQNLAPEGNGYETANRQQYGTYIGRRMTNAFRLEHRLPTDEFVVRTFQDSPEATLLNNGVEHVLNCLAHHWRNMLFQENGNFGHHRQELLDPIKAIRFHMPVVLMTLTNLRGRNNFDGDTLGPLIRRLEGFDPGVATAIHGPDVEIGDITVHDITMTCAISRRLVQILLSHSGPICAGIPPRVSAFRGWLEAILDSIDAFENEAHEVRTLVSSVNDGIRIGYQLIKVTNWQIPDNDELKTAIVAYHFPEKTRPSVDPTCIEYALNQLIPRDRCTLGDLIRAGHMKESATDLLLGRVSTLLHRELRRKSIDHRIIEMSRGEQVHDVDMQKDDWYLVHTETLNGVFQYKGPVNGRLRFKDVQTGNTLIVEITPALVLHQYVPVGEAIARAQKAYMNLEIDHLKKFSYTAFMEFGSGERDGSLRTQLRRLAVVSQLHSYEIDNSRRMVLSAFVKRPSESTFSVKKCKPQNLVVIGGGVSGLVTAIHCVQNCLMSGGFVTLYESRDSYKREAASFELAQVVRLDPRLISMLRFHLGSVFEDHFIPLRGETDAHLGNTVPSQGFAELTIKSLEGMLHREAVELRSRGLMNYYRGSGIDFDVEKGLFSKKGASLKAGDNIRMQDGRWRVVAHHFPRPLDRRELRAGQDYDLLFRREERVAVYRLVEAYPDTYDLYSFGALRAEVGLPNALRGSFDEFEIFQKGTARVEPLQIVLESLDGGRVERKTIDFDQVKDERFQLDVFDSHVLVAAGKPENTDEHFAVTTEEPYGVCCIEGLKVSMLMHLFGEKRFDALNFSSDRMGFVDDLRSQHDQNTRLVGDFTKTVALPPIVTTMAMRLGVAAEGGTINTLWTRHIEKTISEGGVNPAGMMDRLNQSFGDLIFKAKITEEIVGRKKTFNNGTSIPPANLGFQRQRLQTRYFEVGDNFYLGMEIPREFETWKNSAIGDVFPDPGHEEIRKRLCSEYDRLWFESTIDVVNRADVFNPDARDQIPRFNLISSLKHCRLGELEQGEAFTLGSPDGARFEVALREETMARLIAPNEQMFAVPSRTKVMAEDGTIRTAGDVGVRYVHPVDVFEVISATPRKGLILVRNSEGYVVELSEKIAVWRRSDLARGPDGFSESKVALSTFSVSLKVNARTLQVLRPEGNEGYVTAFIGDAQASPHFMRYSELTGAGINAVSFNNFVGQAVAGIDFRNRVKRYSLETNWSNCETVEQGVGHCYGEDGFCRPAFTHKSLVDYLFGRVEEQYMVGEDLGLTLSRDWKYKISAGLVPRGLENDSKFKDALQARLLSVVKEKFFDKAEDLLEVEELNDQHAAIVEAIVKTIGKTFKGSAEVQLQNTLLQDLDPFTADVFQSIAVVCHGVVLGLKQSIDYAFDLRHRNARVSSELFHQPKPVDSFIDDFAIEAQQFANGLTQSVAFAAGSVALGLLGASGSKENSTSRFLSIIFSALNVFTSFGTMANVSRYRNRNEEARVIFFDEKLPRIMRGVFSLMSSEQRRDVDIPNPFVADLDRRFVTFFQKARYYGLQPTAFDEFRLEYQNLMSTLHSKRSVRHFIRRLLTHFVVDIFQTNPYLQDELVEMYKILNEMLHLMEQKESVGKVPGAFELYQELLAFQPRLEGSLQRGTIRFGFLKSRPWHQWSLFVAIRYWLSGVGLWKTLSTETRRVLRKLEAISKEGEEIFLRREVRDFQELYAAGRESETTSLLFSSATIVFYGSSVFTLFRLLSAFAPYNEDDELEWEFIQVLLEISGYSTIFSILGATLATFNQWRKIVILGGLRRRLGRSRRIQLIRFLTIAQQLLSILRIIIAFAGAVSLVWALYLEVSAPNAEDPRMAPLYIALAAVVVGLITVVFFFVIELAVGYGLDPKLGPQVLEPFRDEILALKSRFVDPRAGGVGIETDQNIERDIWEYTAREFIHRYRFDTVFDSDRFGAIFQYLQAGAPGSPPGVESQPDQPR